MDKVKTISPSQVAVYGTQENITCDRCHKERGRDYYVEFLTPQGYTDYNRIYSGICEECKNELCNSVELAINNETTSVYEAIHGQENREPFVCQETGKLYKIKPEKK